MEENFGKKKLEKSLKILFTSDIHGNLLQYNSVVSCAMKLSITTILIGGDLWYKGVKKYFSLPKGEKLKKTVSCRHDYFVKHIFPILKKFLDHSAKNRIILSFGNADFHLSLPPLLKLHKRLIFCKEGMVKLNERINLLCYSCVSFSHHRLKDHERFDFETWELNQKYNCRKNIVGYVTFSEERIKKFGMEVNTKKLEYIKGRYGKHVTPVLINFCKEYSIEYEIKELIGKYHDKKKINIWMMHEPPNGTCGDFCKRDTHVGSKVLRMMAEKYQPLLYLCGHIHESVEKSEKEHEFLGKNCLLLPSGNHPKTKKASCIVIEIGNKIKYERINFSTK